VPGVRSDWVWRTLLCWHKAAYTKPARRSGSSCSTAGAGSSPQCGRRGGARAHAALVSDGTPARPWPERFCPESAPRRFLRNHSRRQLGLACASRACSRQCGNRGTGRRPNGAPPAFSSLTGADGRLTAPLTDADQRLRPTSLPGGRDRADRLSTSCVCSAPPTVRTAMRYVHIAPTASAFRPDSRCGTELWRLADHVGLVRAWMRHRQL
jgi:hypothetical protein